MGLGHRRVLGLVGLGFGLAPFTLYFIIIFLLLRITQSEIFQRLFTVVEDSLYMTLLKIAC